MTHRRSVVFLTLLLIAGLLAGCNLFKGDPVDNPPGDTDPPYVEPPPFDPLNLITNPGFEEVDDDGLPAPWGGRGNVEGHKAPFETGGAVLTSEAARTGQYGVKLIHETSATGNYWLTQRVPLEAGKEYEVSMWVKSELGENGRTAIKFEFQDENGQYIGKAAGGELQKEWNESAPEWEQQVFRFVAPENTHRTAILIRLYSVGWAYFDDVSLRLMEDGE